MPCLNLGIMTFVRARLRERSTRRAICVIILNVAAVASIPTNWPIAHAVAWLGLIKSTAEQFVHMIDGDDYPSV